MNKQSKNLKSNRSVKQQTKAEVILPKWMVWIYALASFLLIPAYYYKPAVDVTLIPKFMVLSGLLLIFVLIFLISGAPQVSFLSLFKRWTVRLWAGFIIISLLSLTAAINPQEGVFDIMRVIISFLYLLITAIVLIRSGSIKPFVISAILLSIGFACIGFYEYFSFAYSQTDLSMLYKVNGLMSHKNVFSVVIFFTLPLIFYSVFTSQGTEKYLSLASLVPSLTLLFLLQTRSVWMALIVFILSILVMAYLFRKKLIYPYRKNHFRGAMLIVVVLLISFATAFFINRSSLKTQVQTYEPQQYEKVENLDKRVASIFDTSSPNRVKRLDIWARTLEMVRDNPVLGIGAGNWKIVAPDYYQPDPDEGYYHNWRRPHNDFLWVLAEKGVPGLLFYLGFFVAIVILTFRTLRRITQVNQMILVILSLAALGGYCADASFAFPYERVDIQMFMMFFVAVLLWIDYVNKPPLIDSKQLPKVKKSNRVVFVFFALLLAIGMSIGQKMVKAEKYVNYAHHAVTTQQWEMVIQAIDLGYSNRAQLDPVNNPMYWYRGHANMNLGKYEEAKEDFVRALQHNPFSVPSLTDMATVHYLQGDYEKALEYYTEAIRIYHLNRHALRLLGLTYFALERYEEAAQNFYRCITDQPNPELDSLINQVYLKMQETQQKTGT